jgi:hypothetical protein
MKANPTQFFRVGDGKIELRTDSNSSHDLNHLRRTVRDLVLDLKLSFR